MPEENESKEDSKIGEWLWSGFFWAMGGALFAGTLELGRAIIQRRSRSRDEDEE